MSSLSDAQHRPRLPLAIADDESRHAETLRRAQRGDRAAYGEIVLALQDRLYNAVLRMVGDCEEAREITQETFFRGLQKLDGFRGDAGPYTWLLRIAMNLAISRLRKVHRHRTFSLDGCSSDGRGRSDEEQQAAALRERLADARAVGPAEEAHRREQNEQVLAALGRLDAEYRALLVMRDIEGFDYQQIADVLGLPLGTLKSRLFRARLALRDELAEYMGCGRTPPGP